jgi:hypothetical protein
MLVPSDAMWKSQDEFNTLFILGHPERDAESLVSLASCTSPRMK